jgi:hypothetical protein
LIRLHVCRLPEDLHQLRDVDEPGKARVQAIACAVRREFHHCHWFAKRRRPAIEMMQIMVLQSLRLQIALHRKHFGHAVGDARL